MVCYMIARQQRVDSKAGVVQPPIGRKLRLLPSLNQFAVAGSNDFTALKAYNLKIEKSTL